MPNVPTYTSTHVTYKAGKVGRMILGSMLLLKGEQVYYSTFHLIPHVDL